MTAGFRPPSAGRKVSLKPVKWSPVYFSLQPRFVVKIDGNAYLAEKYTVTTNAHGATDTAEVTLPIDGDANFPGISSGGLTSLYPDWTVSIQRSDEAGNANIPVVIELWAGFPDVSQFSPTNLAGLTLRFRGVVDLYSVQVHDNKTTFTCRSLAFPLASTKIVTPFVAEQSITTVAFIQQQAKRFGLQMAPPQTGHAPLMMIDVLGSEFISGVRGWYIWDLMLQCAVMDDVDLWVDRTGIIHYEAASLVQRNKVYYQWGKNCKGIDATHSPQYSKNVRVQVHSYKPRERIVSVTRVSTNADGGVTSHTYNRIVSSTPIFGTTESLSTSISSNGTVTTSLGSTSGGGASGGTGSLSESGINKYSFWPRNKTLAQCLQIAQQRWRQISMHEYAIKLQAPVTPADLKALSVASTIVLSGHPMAQFNSIEDSGQPWSPIVMSGGYWPRQIVERFDPKAQSGWDWVIDAVNHPLPQGAV